MLSSDNLAFFRNFLLNNVKNNKNVEIHYEALSNSANPNYIDLKSKISQYLNTFVKQYSFFSVSNIENSYKSLFNVFGEQIFIIAFSICITMYNHEDNFSENRHEFQVLYEKMFKCAYTLRQQNSSILSFDIFSELLNTVLLEETMAFSNRKAISESFKSYNKIRELSPVKPFKNIEDLLEVEKIDGFKLERIELFKRYIQAYYLCKKTKLPSTLIFINVIKDLINFNYNGSEFINYYDNLVNKICTIEKTLIRFTTKYDTTDGFLEQFRQIEFNDYSYTKLEEEKNKLYFLQSLVTYFCNNNPTEYEVILSKKFKV